MSHTRSKTMVSAILPFNPGFPSADIARLQATLKDTRVPSHDIVPGSGQEYGMPTDWATALYNHWLNKFSLTDALARMKAMGTHQLTHIEEMQIHFVHRPSKNPDAIPLLLVHGWPGSFYEFSEVVDSLAEGEKGKPSFHCVVPSLPGFCWSSAPQRRGWTMKDTARLFHKLMQRLGYEKYCVQAGDWGQFVARELGAKYSDSCRTIHLNWCPGALAEAVEPTDRETKVASKTADWRTNHIGYAVLMRTRPQTLGWMLMDNPVGLMSFIGEKYHEAASPSVSSSPAWFDHILSTVCLYYFTRCIMTACLPYYENIRHDQFGEYIDHEPHNPIPPFSRAEEFFKRSGSRRQLRFRSPSSHCDMCRRSQLGHQEDSIHNHQMHLSSMATVRPAPERQPYGEVVAGEHFLEMCWRSQSHAGTSSACVGRVMTGESSMIEKSGRGRGGGRVHGYGGVLQPPRGIWQFKERRCQLAASQDDVGVSQSYAGHRVGLDADVLEGLLFSHDIGIPGLG